MSELFSSLGIDWKIIIAQMANFAILVFVLAKFVYKPVIKMLDERKQRISDDLNKSQTLSEKMKEADMEKERILAEARKESEKIIKQTEKNASEIKNRLLEESRTESELLKTEAKRQIEAEREKTSEALKSEIKVLVSESLKKILGEKQDPARDGKLVEEAVKRAKNF